MTLNDVRDAYLAFLKERGHAEIPSAALVPENDPTTLFTGSGMQPLLPYLLGQEHAMGEKLVNSQKCFRAEDIDEVGDNRHTTFFEMLGNWSLGAYFKQEQIDLFYTFLTKKVGLDPNRLYITVFAGDDTAGIARDTEAAALWRKHFDADGIEAKEVFMGSEEAGGEKGMQGGRIFYYDASKNWWSRAGVPEAMPEGEPGGPDSETFFDFHPELGERCLTEGFGTYCHPNCDCGRFMEIGNSVFMQYQKTKNGFAELPQKNIDFGGGLERIAAASQDNDDVFAVSVLAEVIASLEQTSGKRYSDAAFQRSFRVIADHLRGAVFMIADGILPSNKEAGYFARVLVRRSVQHTHKLGIEGSVFSDIVPIITREYESAYPQLKEKERDIIEALTAEEDKFRATLVAGQRKLDKILQRKGDISAQDAFMLFTTHGFPIELVEEAASEHGLSVDRDGFAALLEEHRAKSREGAGQKFKGGLADASEQTTMLHTATHLMLAGLRKYLGEHVHQAGSNITQERTRFDFTHDEKVSREVLDQVEAYVNDAIQAEADVVIEEMPKQQAMEQGVEGSFWEKYPDVVNVYMVKGPDGTIYSKELCGGPHVHNTREIKGVFKIDKEKASSAGVRRVKATLA